jgi:hypothetical protein
LVRAGLEVGPPTLPVEELLGDLHLASCRPAEARAAYRRSLELHPRRLNSLIGAARAAMALANEEEAEGFTPRRCI